jgi:cytochrome c biogenesis protein CcdA
MTLLTRSFAEVVDDLFHNLQTIVRAEVRLAKSEIREEADKARVAATLTGVGAILGISALAMVLVAGVAALSEVMPVWAAALVIGAVLVAAAGILLSAGVRRFRNVRAVPQRAMDHLKGDIQWVKQHAK